MTPKTQREAEVAVAELRLFVSLYDYADLAPDSRIARQLDAARRALAGYDAVQQHSAAKTA
jgi:hypothetical protein